MNVHNLGVLIWWEVKDSMFKNKRKQNSKNSHGALWAKIAQNVKKPPLTVNVIDFDFFGFNVGPFESPWSQNVMIHW